MEEVTKGNSRFSGNKTRGKFHLALKIRTVSEAIASKSLLMTSIHILPIFL
jgi:hypothetical protein